MKTKTLRDSKFAKAIHFLESGTLECLLKDGADPNTEIDGKPAIHHLCETADLTDPAIHCIKLLIKHGADINVFHEKRTPLLAAIDYEINTSIASLLLSHGAEIMAKRTSLPEGFGDEVTFLLASGMLDDNEVAFEEVLDLLIDTGLDLSKEPAGVPAPWMVQGISTGNAYFIEKAIKAGANLDIKYDGFSLPGWAASRGNRTTFGMLMEAGASYTETCFAAPNFPEFLAEWKNPRIAAAAADAMIDHVAVKHVRRRM